MKINNHMLGINVKVLHEERLSTNRPVIYACTNIGRYNVEAILTPVKSPGYLFYGDPNGVYKNVLGLLVWLNGVIYLDTDNKTERRVSKELAVRFLMEGGSLIIFPEGAWNVTENEIVMKLYSGAAKIAVRSRADIIPIAVDQQGKNFSVSIGRNIRCSGLSMDQAVGLTDTLRNKLASLKWELWEENGVFKRDEIPRGYFKTYIDQIMSESNTGYTLENIIARRNKEQKHGKSKGGVCIRGQVDSKQK